jgi:hypothetical protein
MCASNRLFSKDSLQSNSVLVDQERRTKGEPFRDRVRVDLRYRAQRDRDDSRWIDDLIGEAKAEQANGPIDA